VGGGIVGAGVLRELALRNVPDTVLVEKFDFASGTSGASSKLIHAGIRYLEQAWDRLKELRLLAAVRDFRFVMGASRERKTLGRLAPGLVRPKRIFLVLGAGTDRHRTSVFLGTWVYYLLQLLQGQFFPPPQIFLRRNTIVRHFPALAASRVRAVFSFWDSETDDARLVIENLQDAAARGASALNYVELVSFAVKDDLVEAVLRNAENDERATVRAKVVINAGGPHADEIAGRGGIRETRMLDRVAGAHVDVYPPVADGSYYVTASDGRLVFVLNRSEDGLSYTRIGTTERPLGPGESSDHPKASEGEIAYLLNLVGEFFPRVRLDASTVIGVDAGIRPLRAQDSLSAFAKSREHAILGSGRVFHVIGVKLTDYRRVAREVLNTLPWASCGVSVTPLTDEPPIRALSDPIYREFTPEDAVLRTMVLHWDDYALRRRGARPRVLRRDDPAALEKELGEVSRTLGWSPERTRAEKARVTPPSLP
jgi:glycerol-3-phosphate dehydrogenase